MPRLSAVGISGLQAGRYQAAKDSTLPGDRAQRLYPAIDGGAAVVEQATWLVRVAQRFCRCR